MELSQLPDVIRSLWGDEAAEWTPLVGEVDLNVKVVNRAGDASVLKLMHPGHAKAHLELQTGALERIAASAPDIPVPRVIPTSGGAPFAEVEGRLVWRITWLPGERLESVRPRRPELLEALGAGLARIQVALAEFDHPAAHRDHDWDLARAGPVLDRLTVLGDTARRDWVRTVAQTFRERVEPALGGLPSGLIHGDGNDFNVLVDVWRGDRGAGPAAGVPTGLSGILDFGDMVHTPRVCDVAIAAAYALMGEPDPVAVTAMVARGFHGVLPLSPEEVEVLHPLVRTRLAVSVIRSAERAGSHPHEPYLTVSEAPAWDALERLLAVDDRTAELHVRHALGWEAVSGASAVRRWLSERAGSFEAILPASMDPREGVVLDLSVGSPLLGADPAHVEPDELGRRVDRALAQAGVSVGVGRWNEPRPLYTEPAFRRGDHPTHGARTVHMGLDLWIPAGTPLHAPLDGVVESLGDLPGSGNYGPTLLLRHEPAGVPTFWTLWGHLDPAVLDRYSPGDAVQAGDEVARVGPRPANGDWPPHLHLQLAVDALGQGHDLPGVVDPDERAFWKEVFPNPAILAGLSPDAVDAEAAEAAEGRSAEALLRRRRSLLGPNLSLSYHTPLHLVSGWRQFMRDAEGRWYLDLYNNVPHVGHSHPRVAEAVRSQVELLNTNTRYLHDTVLRYAEALVDRLPAPLEVAYFVNSASEANELALRMARAATGRREIVVMEGAYHGHTSTLIQASPYKFRGPGGEGREPWVATVELPDLYRGPHRAGMPRAAERYAEEAAGVIRALAGEGRPPGAFLAESLPSVGGQIVLPEGYLAGVYQAVRAVGGVCIADEVQVGFGRLGSVFWGFELQGVVPDVVVMGKPMGNGIPLAAVVTSRSIAEAFDNGMEFFSTFGGNPVACAAGLAVLEVLEEEGLQSRAQRLGRRLNAGLGELAREHEVFGDVRGMGLFQGVELVRDPEARTPAPGLASFLKERLAEARILTGIDGPDHNVLKLRGPMVLEEQDVDRFLEVTRRVLTEWPFRSRGSQQAGPRTTTGPSARVPRSSS